MRKCPSFGILLSDKFVTLLKKRRNTQKETAWVGRTRILHQIVIQRQVRAPQAQAGTHHQRRHETIVAACFLRGPVF